MNQQELTELIEYYGRDIYSFCLSLTGNRVDADDLYQETFLTVIRKKSNLVIESNPKSYLLTIAIRRWKDKKRTYGRRKRIVPMESLDQLAEKRGNGSGISSKSVRMDDTDYITNNQPEQMVLEREIQEEIRKLVRELDDKLRIPMYLYYMEELTLEDIGRMLHLPCGTVKSRMHRGRRILKERLVELGYEI